MGENEENCVKNGMFEIVDASNWECVGSACELQVVEGGALKEDRNFSMCALSSGKRDERTWGVAQELDMSCFFQPGTETKKEVSCDPFLYYYSLPNYCPTILIQVE